MANLHSYIDFCYLGLLNIAILAVAVSFFQSAAFSLRILSSLCRFSFVTGCQKKFYYFSRVLVSSSPSTSHQESQSVDGVN